MSPDWQVAHFAAMAALWNERRFRAANAHCRSLAAEMARHFQRLFDARTGTYQAWAYR